MLEILHSKKKVLPLTKEELKLHKATRNYLNCANKILQKFSKFWNLIGLLRYFVDFVVLYNGLNYGYHFIIKE